MAEEEPAEDSLYADTDSEDAACLSEIRPHQPTCYNKQTPMTTNAGINIPSVTVGSSTDNSNTDFFNIQSNYNDGRLVHQTNCRLLFIYNYKGIDAIITIQVPLEGVLVINGELIRQNRQHLLWLMNQTSKFQDILHHSNTSSLLGQKLISKKVYPFINIYYYIPTALLHIFQLLFTFGAN